MDSRQREPGLPRCHYSTVQKKLWDEVVKTITPPPPTISRNAPCPCGSGKKYKLCHYPLTGVGPWWDSVLNSSRRYIGKLPRVEGIDDELMQDICTHVARVERFEEIIRRSPESMPPDLNQTMYDVELIILGAIATFIDEIDYGLEALSLLGSAGEYDPLVEYVYAFSLLEDLVETDEEWNTAIETERRVIGLADKANSETTDILKLFNAKFMVDVGIKREGFAALNDLVKKHPEDPMYPTALATAYLEVNNKRKAVHYLRQALKLAEQEDMDEQILEIAYSLVNLRAMSEKEFVALVEKHDIEIEDEDDFDEDYDDEFDDVEDAREFEMEVILEHPEYAEWFGPKAHLMPDEASDGINPRLHVIVHSIIEKQLELNEPPAVGQALQRLLDQGISRHEAIHRIAALLSEMIFATIKEERAADLRKYERELNKLGR